jgi:type I restriction enzyme, S subunit
MSDEWPLKPFGALLSEPVRNGIYKQKSFHGSGVKIVNMGELFNFDFIRAQSMKRLELNDDELARSLLKDGDLLFARRSVVLAGSGRCVLVDGIDEPTTFESSIIRARPDPAVVCSRFLFYSFRGPALRAKVAAISSQTAVSGVRSSDLAVVEIAVPELSTQRAIVKVIAAYDDLIENCERRIRILDEMARKLYREWFVHFRYPGHETVPLVDSALGKIPKGWRCDTFDKIAIVHRGRSYRSEDMAENGGVPFVNLKCIDRDGGFRRSGIKRFVGAKPEAHAVRQGDIVMAVTDMTQERRIVARAALVPTLDGGYGVVSMDLVRIEPHTEYPTGWLFAHLRYSAFADHLKQHANGANVLHLSPDRIRAYEAVIPSTHIVRSFDSTISPLLAIQNQLTDRVANLRRTRDLLLPRLLSGQLDVGAMA